MLLHRPAPPSSCRWKIGHLDVACGFVSASPSRQRNTTQLTKENFFLFLKKPLILLSLLGFESFSTIGYGERTPQTPGGRLVFTFWAILGVGTMAILISGRQTSVNPTLSSACYSLALIKCILQCYQRHIRLGTKGLLMLMDWNHWANQPPLNPALALHLMGTLLVNIFPMEARLQRPNVLHGRTSLPGDRI